MKKLFYFLIILVAGFWLYGKCSHKTTKDANVLKQVRVNVKTANLRTGPGTNYDFMLDAAGVKRQVSSGTVLDVVAEKKGWYEIRLDGDATHTAYIKQSLCSDVNGSSGRKGGNTGKAQSTSPAPVPDEVLSSPTTSADQDQPSTSPAAPPAEEVVEEVKDGGASEDEVLF